MRVCICNCVGVVRVFACACAFAFASECECECASFSSLFVYFSPFLFKLVFARYSNIIWNKRLLSMVTLRCVFGTITREVSFSWYEETFHET